MVDAYKVFRDLSLVKLVELFCEFWLQENQSQQKSRLKIETESESKYDDEYL